jgi:hypothetical protein
MDVGYPTGQGSAGCYVACSDAVRPRVCILLGRWKQGWSVDTRGLALQLGVRPKE